MRLSALHVVLIVVMVFGAALGSAFFIYKALTADEVAHSAERLGVDAAFDAMGPTVDLGTFTVNLLGGNRYLRSEIVVELTERGSAREIEERLPQVRDAVLLVLRGFSAEDLASPESDAAVKEAITDALNPLLTRGKVSGVYFTSWVIQ